jgi:hypothetical protein
LFEILVRLFGIFIEGNRLQFINASAPILVTILGIVIFVSKPQFLNASAPIVLILVPAGKITVVNFEQDKKKAAGMAIKLAFVWKVNEVIRPFAVLLVLVNALKYISVILSSTV